MIPKRSRMRVRRGSLLRWHAGHLIAAVLLVFGSCAEANFYKCITADGNKIHADREPPECAGRRIEVFRDDGTPLRVIEPPPTLEEIKKRQADEKRRLDEKEDKRAQERSDRSLLETYSSPEEIEAARQRALGDLQKFIDLAEERKRQLQLDRKKLDNEAEFYLKRDMPEELKRAFAANNERMKTQAKTIDNAKAEMARVNQLFDGYKKRFKELLDGGATPVQRKTDAK
jgi:hypothetical protein